MTEKVTVSKEAAESLRVVKEELWPNGDHWKIVRDHVLSHANFHADDLNPLNSLSLDTLIRALYNGYEVERTPEERVVQMFRASVAKGNMIDNPQASWWDGRRMAIIDTLNTLEIKIEGVNK